jgi:HlyD family secretion protein
MKKMIVILIIVLIALGAGYVLVSGRKKKGNDLKFVEAKRGDIAERALAVGTLEPEQEISR